MYPSLPGVPLGPGVPSFPLFPLYPSGPRGTVFAKKRKSHPAFCRDVSPLLKVCDEKLSQKHLELPTKLYRWPVKRRGDAP